MRIGIATPVDGFQGGLERYAFMVARGLRARGHHVRLLHEREGGKDREVFAEAFDGAPRRLGATAVADLDVVYAQRVDGPGQLGAFGDRPLAIASHDHAHTCIRTYRYLPVGAAPCHRAPGVGCVLHGCVVNRARGPHGARLELRDPFALRSRVRALSERALLVPCSRYVGEQLVAAGVPEARVRVVHPIPAPDVAPRTPRPSERRLVVVGQLLRGKGIEHAIDAMAYLPPDVSLRIVGDGPSRAQLQARAAERAPGRVSFTGYVPAEQVYTHYDAARVVVVPSHWPEPFGMVGIEAMRRARPVVAAGHGGIPEWAPDAPAGRLFEPGSPLELAAAAGAMLSSDEAGERALAYTRSHHDHGAMLDAIEALLYEQARAGRAG